MENYTRIINDLIAEFEVIKFSESNLESVLRRIELLFEKIFSKQSDYYKEFKMIQFKPNEQTKGNDAFRSMVFPRAMRTLNNLLKCMLLDYEIDQEKKKNNKEEKLSNIYFMKNVNTLFEKASKLSYPKDAFMRAVPKMYPFGFFPGGYGTFDKTESLENRDIMIIGQDFGTYEYYCNKCTSDGENKTNSATWRNLINLLNLTQIDKDSCFFTNVYMGLRTNNDATMISSLDAKKVNEFVKTCQNFFKEQINIIEPKIVFVLGKQAANFLSNIGVFSELRAWRHAIIEVDKQNKQIIEINYENSKIVFALLTHPSFHHLNLKKRRYKNHSENVEKEIINDSLRIAKL